MRPRSSRGHFGFGFITGLIAGLALGGWTLAQAQRPSQLDILHNLASQNFYLKQKVLAYTEYLKEVNLLLAEKTKVKIEQVVPLTNRLQQETFGLDLKLKELNK